MRILLVIPSVNPLNGGTVEFVTQVGQELEQNGHRITVASTDDPAADWVQQFPLKVHALGPSRGLYGATPHFVPWLRAHHHEFDAVVVNGLWQYVTAGTRRALRKTQTPYFVFAHGMLDPWFKVTYPKKHLKKVFYWLGIESHVLRDAKRVCFTCEEEKLLARGTFRPYKVREAVVNFGTAAPTGNAQTQREAFLLKYPHLRNQRFLLFLSRIHPKKGCDLLVEAFHAIASRDEALNLVIAGPDQVGLKTQLEKLTKELGISHRILWPGMLSGNEKWGAFRAAEAFVLPSHQENFGIVVAEALACGTPVLISNKVNIWREIKAASAGFVASDTQEGITQLLTTWLDTPASKRACMSENAQTCFFQHFEIGVAAQSLVETISESMCN